MLRKPLLLSSAKIGVLQESSHLSWGGVILIIICGFFVAYGALDIAARVFSFTPPTDALTANVTSAITDSNKNSVQIQNQNVRPVGPGLISASGASTSTVETIVPIIPKRLKIPSLYIDAHVQQVGLTSAGAMQNPKGFSDVAWYKPGSRPGDAGNAVIAGHVNNAIGLSGVFEDLSSIQLGSEIIISGDGKDIHYVVREKNIYYANNAPAATIFSTHGPSKLVLITCDGVWDSGVKSYDKRLVVVAEPI